MIRLSKHLSIVSAIVLAGCSKRPPDFINSVRSPSGKVVARFAGYQPRGTIGGVLTLTFWQGEEVDPQITLGHLLQLKAGWLDDHTFVLVYDALEQHKLTSPIYTTADVTSAIRIVSCNQQYIDCAPLVRRMKSPHAIVLRQFPEGSWPIETKHYY